MDINSYNEDVTYSLGYDLDQSRLILERSQQSKCEENN